MDIYDDGIRCQIAPEGARVNAALAAAISDFIGGKTDGAGFAEALSASLSFSLSEGEEVFTVIAPGGESALDLARGRQERVRQASAVLYSGAGSPCVRRVDEGGLADEYGLRDFVTRMTKLRTKFAALSDASVYVRRADERGLIYEKRARDPFGVLRDVLTVGVLLNARDEDAELPLPADWVGRTGLDLLNGGKQKIGDTAALAPYGVAMWEIV
jgi:hypothetical protein